MYENRYGGWRGFVGHECIRRIFESWEFILENIEDAEM